MRGYLRGRAQTGSLVIAGRIGTMDQPPVVEAILIQDGMVATIDTHAHWIGDRDYYYLGSTAEATLDIAGRTARSRLPRGPPRDRERCLVYLTILKPQPIALTIADATPPA